MRKTGAWFVLAALFASATSSRDALACAPAPRAGERIDVVEESAVIVWEPATKTQHFIRRATFQGEARDFGFIVPTPSVPTLAQADDEVFGHLQRKTARQTVHRTEKRLDWTPLVLLPFVAAREKGDGAPTGRAPVEVLSTQKVAGYEAAILDATDANALSGWLAANGYATTPDLAEWLQAYIDQRWIVSAFRVDKSRDGFAQTSAVRMTFTTDRPFFPYREPASQREGPSAPRVLKVWFIGPERVAGRVGESSWPGQMYWSDAVRDRELAGVTIAPGARLTAFEDHATPRPGIDDLFFIRDADQKTVVPPPYEETEYQTVHVPLDLVFAPMIFGGWFFLRKRRRQIRD